MEEKKTLISLKNINKSFGSQKIIEDLSLDIKDGEFLTLLGPSGCGKTTLLRMINGFETPDSGAVVLDGVEQGAIPPNKRQVNTVFQSYALFPHLTVWENVAFSLRMKKVAEKEIKERVDEVLELTSLEALAQRKPAKLSGGQQQRVAIARSLVNKPKVLLLDEPLGALDLKLRKQMQVELKKMQRKMGITYVYVTHDQEEALTISDRIVVLNKGHIEQMGEPWQIYHEPKTEFVASFLGESNFFEGHYEGGVHGGFFHYKETAIPVANPTEEEPDLLSVRPEYIQIQTEKPDGFSFQASVENITYLGQTNRIALRLQEGKMVYALKDAVDFSDGETVFISFCPDQCNFIHSA